MWPLEVIHLQEGSVALTYEEHPSSDNLAAPIKCLQAFRAVISALGVNYSQRAKYLPRCSSRAVPGLPGEGMSKSVGGQCAKEGCGSRVAAFETSAHAIMQPFP